MNEYHKSVLLEEAMRYLAVKPGKKYIDATLGGGGHTKEILVRGGHVLGIDVDEEALAFVKEKLKTEHSKFENFTVARGNFADIDRISRDKGFKKVSGILFDLGVSSHQVDEAERGFSFRENGPLDMRMSNKLTVKASDLINGLSKKELVTLFEKLGEEWNARPIADAIISTRRRNPIVSTKQLADIVESVTAKTGKIHPATKVFQALRIAVNDELNSLRDGLRRSVELLEDHGRIVVISFHSLEDRIVKDMFKDFSETKKGKVLTQKPLTPSEEEIQINPRSRSAKLRVFERII